MSSGVDREAMVPKAVSMYLNDMMSLPKISKALGIPISWIRRRLIASGVKMRTQADGNRIDAPRRSAETRGRPRPPFSEGWKRNISAGRLAHAAVHARGVRINTSGYVEYTRGPHKGRTVHVVSMEQHIGRALAEGECVHHIDENKQNNDISNLMLMTIAEHARHHRLQEVLQGTDRERYEDGKFR